jgi:hypothetical protein
MASHQPTLAMADMVAGSAAGGETDARGANGLGSIYRYVWKGALPYRLTLSIRIIRAEPPTLLEGEVTGGYLVEGVLSFKEVRSGILVALSLAILCAGVLLAFTRVPDMAFIMS